MSLAALREMLDEHGLADEVEALAPLAHLEVALVPDDGATVTRLGGAPDVPPGFAWPCHRWPRAEVAGWPDYALADLARARAAGQVADDGDDVVVMPLSYLATIDLAALRACHADARLPATGRLLLFASVATDVPDARFAKRVAAAVIHVDAAMALTPMAQPPTCDPFPPTTIGLRPAPRLDLALTFEDEQALLARLTDDRQRAGVRAALTRSHALLPAPADELAGPMPPPGWVALARLVDDPAAGFTVGDASWLTFAIPEADLAAGRWAAACASVFIG